MNVLEIPRVMLRGHHVLICLRDAAGNYILGKKSIYPTKIVRFVGGAIEGNEAPLEAGRRELLEETGLTLPEERLESVATVIASITDQHDRSVTFTTYLFLATLNADEVKSLAAADDVETLVTLSPAEFNQLITDYAQLPMTIEGENDFAWGDYGQLYGYVHQLAV